VSDADVIIIGAGIAGVSLAAELCETRTVCVIEAEDYPAYHSTGRSNALWHETYGGPLIQPLTAASRGWLDRPPAGFSDVGFLTPRPTLCIGQDEDAAAIAGFIAEFEKAGVTLDHLGPRQLQALLPGLRPQWTHGVLESNSADIDVAAYHAACLKKIRRAGGKVLTKARVEGLSHTHGKWSVRTAFNTLSAPIIVNAAGAWADGVAAMAGVAPLSITPYRRTLAQVRIGGGIDRNSPMVTHIHGTFYFKSDTGNRIWLSPHDETASPPCDAAPEELDIAVAIDRFQQVVDWPVEAVEHAWAGLRSFAPDRLPIFGFEPSADGFFWCAGQGGFGIQTAPAIAKLSAAQILQQEPGADYSGINPALYAPDRLRN
jgi:D-arginine dehydrogenase